MEQVLIGGIYNLLHTTDTEYNVVGGAAAWLAGASKEQLATVISTGGTLKNLRVELNDVPGTGTYTFTLHRAVGIGAWANTALTCTVAADGTTTSDTSNEIAVAAGDVVLLECNPDSPDNARYAKWSMVFEGDTANESLLLAQVNAWASDTVYCSPMGVTASGFTTEDDARCVCPTGGTIKNLYVQLHTDPGGGDDAYKITLRIGGVSKALTVTITADDRTGNNVADEIAVSAGNVLTVMVEPLNSPSAWPYMAVGMTFVADTDGESLILGGLESNLDDTNTEYSSLNTHRRLDWKATEAEKYQLAQVCTLKKLYMLLSDSPGADNDYTFTVRKNAASPASGLVVEIADAATTGNDTTNTITIANDDELDLMVVPTDTPTVRDAYWGLVGFISPVAGWTGKISGVTNPAKIMGVDVANIKSVKGVE